MTFENGESTAYPWLWLDYVEGVTDEGMSGTFEGQLRVPRSGRLVLENTMNADLELVLGGKVLYRGNESHPLDLSDFAGSVQPFRLAYTLPPDPPLRGQIALMRPGLFGGSTLAPSRYAPPGSGDTFKRILLYTGALMGIAGVVALFGALRLSRVEWGLFALIALLSVGVRLLSLSEKFANDPALWSMDLIFDNYLLMGRGWLAGTVHVAGSHYQQGQFVYLGLLQNILGPDQAAIYTANVVIAGFGAVLLTLAAWAYFDRTTGLIAGALAALFAPLIHYQQTLQIVSPAVLAICILVAASAALYRRPHPVFALIAGLVVGVGGVFRGTLLALLPFLLLVPILSRCTRAVKLKMAGLILAGAVIGIAPVTIANYRAGVPALLTNELMSYQLFRSNNLDSTAMNTFHTQSELLAMARGEDWSDALRRELEHDPGHALELTVRRLALFWDETEHADSGMIDYVRTGLDVSPTLRFLSGFGLVNFRLLMILAVFGLVVGLLDPAARRQALILGAGIACYIGSLLAFYVIGRVRAPVAGFLIVLAALGIGAAFRELRNRKKSILHAALLAGSILLALGMNALIDYFPCPTTVRADDIPDTLVPVNAVFGDEIELLGYAYYDSGITPGSYLTFELFWKALAAPSEDYVLAVRYVDAESGEFLFARDMELGTESVPPLPASSWKAGDIYYERYLLALPSAGDSPVDSYAIAVGLYRPGDQTFLLVGESSAPLLGDFVRLTGAAVTDGTLPEVVSATDNMASWGDVIALERADCIQEGQAITVSLEWLSLGRSDLPLHQFTHVFAGGELVDQYDGPPFGLHPTDALPAGVEVSGSHVFSIGTQTPVVRIGVYDLLSGDRVPLSSAVQGAVDGTMIELDCPVE